MISFQADKVRLLKSSGVGKSIWQPEVAILLDLKKKLEMAKKTSTDGQPPLQNTAVNEADVKHLEEEVTKQVCL